VLQRGFFQLFCLDVVETGLVGYRDLFRPSLHDVLRMSDGQLENAQLRGRADDSNNERFIGRVLVKSTSCVGLVVEEAAMLFHLLSIPYAMNYLEALADLYHRVQ
jgi:hypothetical protein